MVFSFPPLPPTPSPNLSILSTFTRLVPCFLLPSVFSSLPLKIHFILNFHFFSVFFSFCLLSFFLFFFLFLKNSPSLCLFSVLLASFTLYTFFFVFFSATRMQVFKTSFFSLSCGYVRNTSDDVINTRLQIS